MTVSQLLDRACARNGAGDAAIFAAAGRRLSWYDLRRISDDVAASLLALGIRRGDRVGIWASNRPEWICAQFGTARIGAILVNINPAYQRAELEYALNKVQCKALIMARALKSSDYLGMIRALAPEIESPAGARLDAARLPHLRHVIVLDDGPLPAGAMRFDDFLALAGPAQRARLPGLCAALDPDDAINIQFTSGTTGAPKGATLTHFNIVNNARHCAKAMALTARDRLCIPVPLYHCFGMVLGVLCCTAVGAVMVFPGETFDAAATLAAIARHKCTALHGVPTMFIAQLDHPDFASHDISSLRTGIMAGAPCPIETMRRVIDRMHMREVTIAYGMTETSPISFQSGIDDPIERRVSTVGRIQPHIEVKIVDADGRVVPVGTAGELCTRGYCVMRGYWEDPERTAESIDESGWMHSGDLATIDAEGYCNIVGRVKDMLIRGGENVYPREIEEFLYRHPKVQSVQVFGVPDARYGEAVCAFIVLKPGGSATAEEIQAFCRGQIAHFKIPQHVRFVPEFPVTATGKPQKFVMREQMIRELGVADQKTA
ncbi:MAG: AMP-binding protein [Xanthobacteraceae bacterium]|nr:AMP-binding protein [Xanthobacteraceae bacterium]